MRIHAVLSALVTIVALASPTLAQERTNWSVTAAFKATGKVYNLKSRRQFAGRYTAKRTGFVVGKTSRGKMWLKNSNGVYLELTVERSGLMLTFGVDDLTITMK